MADASKKSTGAKVPPNVGKIEHDVPPTTERTDYPWPQMKLGDSIVQPAKASSSARSFVKQHRPGWRVREEQLPEFAGYIRIWFLPDGPVAVGEGGEMDAEYETPEEAAQPQ